MNCSLFKVRFTLSKFLYIAITVAILHELILLRELTHCSLKHFLQILQNLEFTYAKFLL
jgi:hypothetical protein